ncbi:beta-lactamase family protein [Bacillus cereus]|nr:beta-lactamase family protein [Bacillus cereus]
MYTYDKFISWVEDIKEKNHSSATALCIIKDNKIVLEHYSGYHSNTSSNEKVSASSQFNVASARKSFPELLKERVFKPANFQETGWRIQQDDNLVAVVDDPNKDAISEIGTVDDGTEKNLFVSAREFAQWGNLHLNQGMIHDKQIVPKEVIKIATSLQSPTYVNKELPQNGLFWFVQNEPAQLSELGERVPKGSYQILGITGPTILVIPVYNVVVAKMYNKRYNYGGDNYLYYLREFSNLVADTFRNSNRA